MELEINKAYARTLRVVDAHNLICDSDTQHKLGSVPSASPIFTASARTSRFIIFGKLASLVRTQISDESIFLKL